MLAKRSQHRGGPGGADTRTDAGTRTDCAPGLGSGGPREPRCARRTALCITAQSGRCSARNGCGRAGRKHRRARNERSGRARCCSARRGDGSAAPDRRTDGRTQRRRGEEQPRGAPHGPARVPPRKRRLRVGRIGVPAPPPPASATEAPLRGSTAAALGGGAGLRLRLRPPHGPAHRAHGAAPLPFVLRAAGGRCAR